MPGCSLSRAPASLHVGMEQGRAEQSSWAAASWLNAAGAVLAPLPWSILPGTDPEREESPGPLPSLPEAGDAGLLDQSPPADGGGGNAATELPISTLYLLQGPLAMTFEDKVAQQPGIWQRQQGLAVIRHSAGLSRLGQACRAGS